MSVNESITPIECYDADTKELLAWFPNISEAAKSIGVNESRIRYVCQGKRITAANLTFKYVDSLDPNESEEEKRKQVKKIVEIMRRPNPRYPQGNTTRSEVASRSDRSRSRSRRTNLKNGTTEDGAGERSFAPNIEGAIQVAPFDSSRPRIIPDMETKITRPLKVAINPSHPLYLGLISYVVNRVAPLLLQRGSMCKANLRYPQDLWLPRNADSPTFESKSYRSFFRPVCIIDNLSAPVENGESCFADYFLQLSQCDKQPDSNYFIVFDGIRLYRIPFSQIVLPVEDALVSYMSTQAMDSIDDFPKLISRDISKWIGNQWTLEEVSAYSNTLSHFSTGQGHIDLNMLYHRNKILNRRKFSELVEFHYSHPVFSRLHRAKIQVKYCSSSLEKTSYISRIEILEREKAYVMKVFRCSTICRKSLASGGSTESAVNFLYRERLLSIDVTRSDKRVSVEHLPIDDINDVLTRYDKNEAFDSMDDEVTYTKYRSRSSRTTFSSPETEFPRGLLPKESSESDLESISDESTPDESIGHDNSALQYQASSSQDSAQSPQDSGLSSSLQLEEFTHSSKIRYVPLPEDFKRNASCRAVVQIDMLSGQAIRLFKSINCVCRFLNIRCSSSIRKSIQSGKPSYGAFIWRDYDGPEIDFDNEPGQFYDLRVVSNFDWQPKLSFRAKESIAAYQDIRHEDLPNESEVTPNLDTGIKAANELQAGSSVTNIQRDNMSLAQRQSMILADKCSDAIASFRRSNIREARIWYKGKMTPMSEALRWLPRQANSLPDSYFEFINGGSLSTSSSTVPEPSRVKPENTRSNFSQELSPMKSWTERSISKPPEKKWSYQFYILDVLSRLQFNSMDPDLYDEIFKEILRVVDGQWTSIDRNRCFRAIDALYELDHVFERSCPPSSEHPTGFDTPVLSSSGQDLLKRLRKREEAFSAQWDLYQQSLQTKSDIGSSFHIDDMIPTKSSGDEKGNTAEFMECNGAVTSASAQQAASSSTNSLSPLVEQWMQRYMFEDMVVAVFQLGAFDSPLHTLALNAFFCHAPNCPKDWRTSVPLKQQVEILRHALDYACFSGYLKREKGYYAPPNDAPVLPWLQVLASNGDIILDKKKEDVCLVMDIMLNHLENNASTCSVPSGTMSTLTANGKRRANLPFDHIISLPNLDLPSNVSLICNHLDIDPINATSNGFAHLNELIQSQQSSSVNMSDSESDLQSIDQFKHDPSFDDTRDESSFITIGKRKLHRQSNKDEDEDDERLLKLNLGRKRQRKLNVEDAAQMSKNRPQSDPSSTQTSSSNSSFSIERPLSSGTSKNSGNVNIVPIVRAKRATVLAKGKRARALVAVSRLSTLFAEYARSDDDSESLGTKLKLHLKR